MAVPSWDKFMIPCLEVLADGSTRQRREIVTLASNILQLTDADRSDLISSGGPRYVNRTNWAITYLNKAGAISSPARGHWSITEKGTELLHKHPQGLTEKALRLEGNENYLKFITPPSHSVLDAPDPATSPESNLTPLEQVEDGQRRNEDLVADELLRRLHEREPVFFEQAVLDLLMAMGYGGSLGSAKRTQLTNDKGIDGVIDQDALGLSRIYVQAKRYEMSNTITRPDVQAFVGALHGAQASQGVFLTTCSFTAGAKTYADSVSSRVVLIDGPLLSKLMIRHGVGVQIKRRVHIVEVDEDYFD